MLAQFTRPRPVPRRLVAALGATALLSTAACSGGSESSGEGGGSSGAGDATLALPIQAQPNSLDPAQLQEGQQAFVWTALFDSLFVLDENGEPQPYAAESYEYSEDLQTLTLTLREGMTFSNGDPVTAEDVAATLERTRTTPGPQQPKLASVESVEAPDERTVVLDLSAPDPTLLSNLALAAGVIGDAETLDDESTALDPVGSGPYELDTEATVTGATYVLNRRDDYWNVEDYPFETFRVRVIQDQTAAFNALQSGEINAGSVQPAQAQQLQGADFTISELSPNATASLKILDREGTEVPALADVRVRQAINMAFDREGIVEGILQGNGQTTETLFAPGTPGYVEPSVYDYDPEAARALLAEAGYPDGFELTLPATVVSTNFQPTVSQALGEIGIDVTWEPLPPTDTGSAIQSGAYPAAFWIESLDVPSRVLQDHYSETGSINPFDTVTPEIQALYEEIATTADVDARAGLYEEAGTVVVEQALDAPIGVIGTRWATTDGIEFVGTGARPLSTIRAFDVAE
ncbi:ABC transporter substrate-binding protein [Modestobacter sp. VKM Ac-2985]|uniref:ABC transporter substrate-binding protein n=1 Tax=Modestobacter sp. VKM Ac-2985 TaxID=3004139 RepID=UPI0022AB84B3|nr:ABC transporter substrate-binding protein [Modestobacter sp. VKM Ac-2985]MCZ2840159.1 ABC transporter substrate-binding protein [Modestobacter sp. VKM Ac-2985]